jgi:2-polyprenyl-3-methyl-5-hydroxy-6-metoxy-1,4-benzoquinol methylase
MLMTRMWSALRRLAQRPHELPRLDAAPTTKTACVDEPIMAGHSLPRFEAALRAYLNDSASHPMHEVWLEYALSSLRRGQDAVTTLHRFTSLAGRRCLDLGCAYGGFPVACALAGAEAVGVELDPVLLRLARELLADVPCSAQFLQGDAMDSRLIERLGRFHVVTCNDVIEHVDDPLRLLAHINQLLKPGGLLFMEIPNKFCLEAVLKDGHYGLFGITLLPRPQALAYYEQMFAQPYTVGEYLHLPEYFEAMDRHGLDVGYLNWVEVDEASLTTIRNGMAQLAEEYPDRVAALPVLEETRHDLRRACAEYVADFAAVDRRYRACVDPSEQEQIRREVALTYRAYMWQLVAVKRTKAAVSAVVWMNRQGLVDQPVNSRERRQVNRLGSLKRVLARPADWAADWCGGCGWRGKAGWCLS